VGEKPMAFFITNLRGTNPKILAAGSIQPEDIVAPCLQYPGFIEEMNI